jgi:hypothetical protein
MTFNFHHDGKTYQVSTRVGGDEFTRVDFLEEDPRPAPAAPLDASGDDDE